MSDIKTKPKHNLLKLSIGALGIVFGDIGTSPLYAMRVCFAGAHGIAITDQNIYGILSMIFWSLILVISLKYLIIILKADNEGEGGILALMKLVLPIKKSSKYLVILSMGLFGAALLYGDGMITPAISVLSALEGLQVATSLFYFIMTTWYKGKRLMRIQLEKVIDPLKKFQTYYQKNFESIINGTAIYLARDPSGTPSALVFNLLHNKVLHDKIIILSVQFIAVPHVEMLEKIEINKLDKHITHVVMHYGYLDKTDIPQALELLKDNGLDIDQKNATYFLGRDSIVIAKHTGMSPLRETFFNFMGRNSVKATRYFKLPSEKVCIIGSQIRL